MRICIVGGIFGKPPAYREKHALTPETILAKQLAFHNIEVITKGHEEFRPDKLYDIVHVHHLAHAAVRMSISRSSPFVFTGHSGPLMHGYQQSILRKGLYRFVLHRADAIVALSKFEAACLKDLGVDSQKIDVIYNGISSEIFQPRKAEVDSPGVLRILFVGQLIPLKGIEILFEALSILRGDGVSIQLDLVYQIDRHEEHYIALANEMGIMDLVNFRGFMDSHTLSQVYRSVDLLVLPSYAEALPSVITEALLSGLPIVATEVGGIPEQVGSFGKLVAPGNSRDLADAIDEVRRNLPWFRSRAKEIHDYAASKFGIRRMTLEHIRLYEKLLASHSASPQFY